MLLPLRDFFRNPDKVYYQLSPDGEYIAYLAPYADRLNIFVQHIATQNTHRVTAIEDRSLSDYQWKGSQTLLFAKDNGGDENYHIYATNLDGTQTRDLTPYDQVRAEITDDLPEHDTDILISLNLRNPELFDIYRLNVLTGEMTLVVENPGGVMAWVSDHNGIVRVGIASDGINNTILYRPNEHSSFEPILQTSYRDNFMPRMFDFDNQHLLVSSNIGRDKIELVRYNPVEKRETNIIFAHDEVDVSGINYSILRQKLTMIYYTTWKTEFAFLDETTKEHYQKITAQLNTQNEVFISSYDDAEQRCIVRVASDRSMGAYYLYDVPSNTLTHLADVGAWLKPELLCDMKPIRFVARDGLLINGYLTLPQGRPAEQLPVVVNPHGGPWARDNWGFNPQVQFLANRGYAVLQINFRGSTGFGKAFWAASHKQWGLAMQDDITDGVQYLIEQGIADPRRIAIYGASYGGYATLAGITFTPDLYACAIDYVGVSNLFTFLQTIPPYWKPMLEMMYEMVGHPEHDREQLIATSPVFHTDKIKTPLLVAQGAKDPRVNINESDQIVNALRARGVTVQYIVKENEGHGFHNQENRFEFYEALEAFLDKHLKQPISNL